jgi:tol-pal system protein YbgF
MKHIALFFLLSTSAFAQSGADLVDRIQRLESQIRQTNGRLEEAENKNRELETRLKKINDDVDFRFNDLSKKPVAAPVQPKSLSDLSQNASKGGLSNDPAAGGLSGLTGKISAEEKFKEARKLIDEKKYEAAEAQFRIFIEQNPNDKLIGEAYYYLGETQYQRKMYKVSIAQFLKVTTNYDKALRAPNAVLRLGQALYSIGEREQSCGAFGELLRKYPNAAANIKTAAEQAALRAKC